MKPIWKLSLVVIFFFGSTLGFTESTRVEPISVYLTFEEVNTSSSVTVNLFLPEGQQASMVYYDTNPVQGGPEAYQFSKTSRVQFIERVGYEVHSAKIENLTANTRYYFTAGSEASGFSRQFWFRTMPDDDSPVRIIQGGDMSPAAGIPDIAELAMTQEPDAILIGGDIAYANGNRRSFPRWVEWFQIMNAVMIRPNGRLIPMIASIGNHETNGSFDDVSTLQGSVDNAPFFFKLFPQDGTKSNFVRHFGSHTALYVLDTGHTQRHSSQVDWMRERMAADHARPNKLALYHVPLYPSHRSFGGSRSAIGRKYWVPVFDEFDLSIAFENHDHTMKRTKMMVNSQEVNSGGTVYVGDGCWGRGARRARDRDYLVKSLSEKHVWLASMDADSVDLIASGPGGEVFDEFSISTSGPAKVVESQKVVGH